MPIYGKNLLKSSPEPSKPWGLIFAQIIGDRRSTKIAKMIDIWPFYSKVNLLPHAFAWALYIYMEKVLRIHPLDISSVIQLNRNLMMSIRTLSRHKFAKWADRKSKMAAAAILKINIWHFFPNLWLPSTEICSVALGWLLDRNELKLYRSEIQDGCSGSLNKMAARAKSRKSSNNISSLANGLISKYLHRSIPPVALYQNC